MSNQILDKITDIAKNQAKNSFSPEELTNALLALINEREAKILRLRYGFNIEKTKTLAAIGKIFNLTRERVRQIENQAIKNIVKNNQYDLIIAPFKNLIVNLVAEHGGLMSENYLINRLKELTAGRAEAVPHIQFLLANFLSGLEKVSHQEFEPSWRLLDLTFELVLEIILNLEKILTEKKQVLSEEEFIEHFKKSDFYQEKLDKINELLQKSNSDLSRVINSYLHASKKFTATPLKQWGLSHWQEVNPKRINAKIYLVMLHHKKPLHFTELADIINRHWQDARQIKTATVHNELIFDDRFVLVGRGIYGLKEWGYLAGNVKDVVIEILKAKSLTEEEIIAQVQAKKMVKPATIKLILKDKDSFEKNSDGKYQLKKIAVGK